MIRDFNLEEFLNTDVDPFLNRDYIDMLNKLDELNTIYSETYDAVSDILDKDLFDDLYRSHMAMTASFDSSRLGLKGKERAEILEISYRKRYKSIEHHINILKEQDVTIDIDYIKNIYSLLSDKESEFRTLPRHRIFNNGKMKCSTDVEKDMDLLVEFINNEKFGKYTLVYVAMTQLALISIAPFDKNNRYIAILLADKLIEKHYGKSIYMETVLYKLRMLNDTFMKEIRRFWKTSDFQTLMKIYIESIMLEMDSNISFLKKLKIDIIELHSILSKGNIRESCIPFLIRFLILNNNFKIKDLHNRLKIKDRRTIHRFADELENLGIVKNISDTRVKKYIVDNRWHNDFRNFYK